MAKAKPGQRVGHRGTKQTGVITSVIRGVANVMWRDGTTSQVHTGRLFKVGGFGCGLIVFVVLVGFPLMTAATTLII